MYRRIRGQKKPTGDGTVKKQKGNNRKNAQTTQKHANLRRETKRQDIIEGNKKKVINQQPVMD